MEAVTVSHHSSGVTGGMSGDLAGPLCCSRPLTRTAEEEVEESIFQQAYIPRNLEEVDDYERDHQRLEDGGAAAQGIYFDAMSGMLAERPAPSRTLPAPEMQPVVASAEPSPLSPVEEPSGGGQQTSGGGAAAPAPTADAGTVQPRCAMYPLLTMNGQARSLM